VISNPPAELPWTDREKQEEERAIFDDEEIFTFPYKSGDRQTPAFEISRRRSGT
jgi:hypothetical protein